MKVTVKQQPEEFKPVTLEITLESKEELEIMHEIVALNVTIPRELTRYGRHKVEHLLGNLFSTTSKLILP